MTILVADDHDTNRKLLRNMVEAEGYRAQEASTGREALNSLNEMTAPVVGLIDWEMPEMSGIEVCQEARKRVGAPPMFLILLTVRDDKRDIVKGLNSGANDYVTKPFDSGELLARLRVGVQMTTLQQALVTRAADLQAALDQIKVLGSLLPICSYCKKIRDDENYWQQVDEYITARTRVSFSHGVCPECYEARVKPELAKFRETRQIVGSEFAGAKVCQNKS